MPVFIDAQHILRKGMTRRLNKKEPGEAEPTNDPPLLVSVAANKGAVTTNTRIAESSCTFCSWHCLQAR